MEIRGILQKNTIFTRLCAIIPGNCARIKGVMQSDSICQCMC